MICYLLVGNKYRLGDALLSSSDRSEAYTQSSCPSGTGPSCLSFQALRASRVEIWRGNKESRFQTPLIKPDVRISRIRLSDKGIT
jgi:hypothetical protein